MALAVGDRGDWKLGFRAGGHRAPAKPGQVQGAPASVAGRRGPDAVVDSRLTSRAGATPLVSGF